MPQTPCQGPPTRQSAGSKKNLGEQRLQWHSIRLIVCRCAHHPSGAFGFDSSGQCDSGIHVGGQVLKPRSVLSGFVVVDNWQENKVLCLWWVRKQLPRLSPSAPFLYQCFMQHPHSLPASPPTLALTPCFCPAHPAQIHLGYPPASEARRSHSLWLSPQHLNTLTSCSVQPCPFPPNTKALPRQLQLPSSRCPDASPQNVSSIPQTWTMRRCLPCLQMSVSSNNSTAVTTMFLQWLIQWPVSIAWLRAPTLAYSTSGMWPTDLIFYHSSLGN